MRSASPMTAGSSSPSAGPPSSAQSLCAASRASGTVVVKVADAGTAIAQRNAWIAHACGSPANASRNARATAWRSAISAPAIAPAGKRHGASGTRDAKRRVRAQRWLTHDEPHVLRTHVDPGGKPLPA